MQTPARVLTGCALACLAGCQSYFPNSHGGAGPYSAFPPGTYAPASGTAVQGQARVPPGNRYQPSGGPQTAGGLPGGAPPLKDSAPAGGGPRSVPVYNDPNDIPSGLGTPLDDPEGESIKRPTGRLDNRRQPSIDLADESDEIRAALGDGEEEVFTPPRKLQTAAATDEGETDEFPRIARRAEPNPYRRDPGYRWLMGRVARDGDGWRLRYSDDPADFDRYDGALQILADEEDFKIGNRIDQLQDDEVIRVYGRIDASHKDQAGKPVYRITTLQRMQPSQKALRGGGDRN